MVTVLLLTTGFPSNTILYNMEQNNVLCSSVCVQLLPSHGKGQEWRRCRVEPLPYVFFEDLNFGGKPDQDLSCTNISNANIFSLLQGITGSTALLKSKRQIQGLSLVHLYN